MLQPFFHATVQSAFFFFLILDTAAVVKFRTKVQLETPTDFERTNVRRLQPE
jgi:hypothetical protein